MNTVCNFTEQFLRQNWMISHFLMDADQEQVAWRRNCSQHQRLMQLLCPGEPVSIR